MLEPRRPKVPLARRYRKGGVNNLVCGKRGGVRIDHTSSIKRRKNKKGGGSAGKMDPQEKQIF